MDDLLLFHLFPYQIAGAWYVAFYLICRYKVAQSQLLGQREWLK